MPTLCSVEGCTNKSHAQGLCQTHYKQKKYAVGADGPTCGKEDCSRPLYAKGLCRPCYRKARRKPDPGRLQCKTDGCDKPAHARGLCPTHYAHERHVAQTLPSNRTCERDGCELAHYANGLCQKHYAQQHHMDNREYHSATRRLRYENHREDENKAAVEWQKANPEAVKLWATGRYEKLKREMLLAYGDGSCACCGRRPDNIFKLELDHVNGDGAAHKLALTGNTRAGVAFYAVLRRLGWPNDPPLQTLCPDCHSDKTLAEQQAKREQLLRQKAERIAARAAKQ